jgi:nitrate reductase (cytochrome), electron transfer subunit
MRQSSLLLAIPFVLVAGSALTQAEMPIEIDRTRNAPLALEEEPPPMRPQMDADVREVRNYPEQPPVIPHAIEGYQVTANFNECLDCHARSAIGVSQAPMVSVTHFMDRNGQVLAEISPRRYFCTACHVPQYPVDPLVENTFVDVDTLLRQESGGE